ncbi:hypothetical protein Tco_0503072 [Tanacetum coccineum]
MDGKKVIITESTIRRDHQLEDAKSTDCLPNTTIFEELTRMGYEKLSQKLTFYKAFFSPQWKFLIHTILQCLSAKTTAWNEFSSTMASAIICLDTNQKFNFSKYIFESMVKNFDNVNKFLMYLRFVQVFFDQQVGDMSSHKRIYVTPSHTKKIFGNIKREGKGLANPTDPHHTPTIIQPLTSQPQKKQKPRKPKRKDTEVPQPSGPTTNVEDEDINKENVSTHSNDPLLSVKKLVKKGGSGTHKLKRLYKVGRSARVVSSDEASLGDQDDASKQGRKIDDINADAGITLDSNPFGLMKPICLWSTYIEKDDEVFNEKEVPIEEVSVVALALSVKLKTQNPLATSTTASCTIITAASTRPKAKGLVIDDQEQAPTPTPIVSSQQSSQVKDKGKGSEAAKEKRIRANIALTEEWNDIQAKIKTDYELAQRLQAEEQEELTIEEKSKLTELVEGTEMKESSKKAEVMEELAQESSSKRAGDELEQENAKKHKGGFCERNTEQEKVELQSLMEIVSDKEGVAIDAIPLATKPPSIMKDKHGSTRPEEGYERVEQRSSLHLQQSPEMLNRSYKLIMEIMEIVISLLKNSYKSNFKNSMKSLEHPHSVDRSFFM